jgi:ribosomal protein S18 acetylase RimI-like enzyme
MKISEVRTVTEALLEAFGRLLPQLSPSYVGPSRADLHEIVSTPGSVLFVAEDPETGEIVGTLTLVVFRIPSGVRAWIEDVIVDQGSRNRGIGEALSRAAVERAIAAGARAVDLTSRGSRAAANRLYQRLGFVAWDTNLYRYPLRPDEM